uniref:Uncharacterized protein n=1 Tax=Oryza sativa subsp. japonica TaxID=39947 RepID=Q5Z5H9_ORYSJ|nr:hypothetical protein [Oryza sativa Japonica Group]
MGPTAARQGHGHGSGRPGRATARGGAATGCDGRRRRTRATAAHTRERRHGAARGGGSQLPDMAGSGAERDGGARSDGHQRWRRVASKPGRRLTKGRKREREGSAHRGPRRRRGGRRQRMAVAGLLDRRSSPAIEGGGAPADFRRRGAAAEDLLVLAELREVTAQVGNNGSGGSAWLEAVAATQCGGDGSSNGARLESSGGRRRLSLARGERERARGARENWENGRGEHGDRFYCRGARVGGGGGGIGGDVGRPWRRFRLREPEVRDGPDRWGRASHLSAKGERGGRIR